MIITEYCGYEVILESFPSQQTRQLFLNGYAAEVLGQEQNEDFISGFDVSELVVSVGDYNEVIYKYLLVL